MITIEVGEMEVKFKNNLSGIGWATCIVEVNGQKLEFTASYLTDCLNDFLRSLMLLIISNYKPAIDKEEDISYITKSCSY